MKISFSKYQGTGNDFVMIDNRHLVLSKNDTNLIRHMCDRRFGIGADGLILLEKADHKEEDFKMIYFNADGKQSSMCGNGGRCIVAFAADLGIIGKEAVFSAIDGEHESVIEHELIGLRMKDVREVNKLEQAVFLDTGSPHHVIFTGDVGQTDVLREGKAIRQSPEYRDIGGTNVNFVQELDRATFRVRTFERGVEDETLSCGTGVTAVAIAAHYTGRTQDNTVHLETPGGNLAVTFECNGQTYENIWLTGPATMVFKGEIEWKP